MNWIMDNLATIVVEVILLTAVILAVRTLLKDRKKGGCSCGCDGCSCAGKCHHSEQ